MIDLGALGFDAGAHLIVRRALAEALPGERLAVHGSDPALAIHLGAWCRSQGHRCEPGRPGEDVAAWVVKGAADRWRHAARAGTPAPDGAVDEAEPAWGLAARGALVEPGGPPFAFPLDRKAEVWADEVPRLYAQAAAAQWDPATAIPWDAPVETSEEVEAAVVQIMTYLIENEHAALVVPSRFIAQIHPHFREVLQLLAIQAADEARHVEVFTRRALLRGGPLGTSSVGGQRSLKTLLDEPDFALAAFLLSIMGEGTFLALLAFIERHAPDPVTRAVARLAAQDEARHVAFGMAHLQHRVGEDPALLGRLEAAVLHRHEALAAGTDLNEDVFAALVLLAAGSWEPEAVREGYARVKALEADMDRGRRGRLMQLGFPAPVAAELSVRHTRSFM